MTRNGKPILLYNYHQLPCLYFENELLVVKSRVCTHVPLGNQHACHDTLHKCASTWNKWSSCKSMEKRIQNIHGWKYLEHHSNLFELWMESIRMVHIHLQTVPISIYYFIFRKYILDLVINWKLNLSDLSNQDKFN